jgi:hypothetical protein
LKENRWNGTVAPQLVVRRVFDTPDGYESLRSGLAEAWREGPEHWSPEVRRIFAELGLDGSPARKRQLLESQAFRDLLAREAEVLPRAA